MTILMSNRSRRAVPTCETSGEEGYDLLAPAARAEQAAAGPRRPIGMMTGLPYSSLERDFGRRRQTRKKALETMSPSRDPSLETTAREKW